MTASILSRFPLLAGGALLGSMSQAARWVLARYMRAPLAATGIMAMVTLSALAGSNALYFQTEEHPSPFFMQPRAGVAALPTPVVVRPEQSGSTQSVSVSPALPQMAPAQSMPEALGSAAVPAAPVGNAQMFAVQKKLHELGLFTGKVDGYYGPRTAEAIRAFEQRNGMTPTGAMDAAVFDIILRADSAGNATVQRQSQVVQAPVVQPVVEVAAVQPPVAQIAPVVQTPREDLAAARLPALSPAEQAFDSVAQSAADTIDSIIAAVDGARGSSSASANPPIPSASLPVQAARPVQATPQAAPQLASVQPASATPVRIAPANDTELVTQIQRGLASLGFFRARVDGKPGPETARAIREFENFYSYRMTGQVQPDLVELLLRAGATI